jgi:hypothetical protein
MVYGSYFAAAQSADACKAKMAVSGRTRQVLDRMARQIRCSFIGGPDENTSRQETHTTGQEPIVFFNCEDEAEGWIFRLVTTHRLFTEKGYAHGLFDITYKFDKSSGTLYLSQSRFTGTSDEQAKDRNFRPILTGVQALDLDFFDGHRWLKEWDFRQEKDLPAAVKIAVTCTDKNYRQCRYGTIAYVNCSKRKNRTSPENPIVR